MKGEEVVETTVYVTVYIHTYKHTFIGETDMHGRGNGLCERFVS